MPFAYSFPQLAPRYAIGPMFKRLYAMCSLHACLKPTADCCLALLTPILAPQPVAMRGTAQHCFGNLALQQALDDHQAHLKRSPIQHCVAIARLCVLDLAL